MKNGDFLKLDMIQKISTDTLIFVSCSDISECYDVWINEE